MMEFHGKEILSGTANANTLTLGAPLSLWNGIDSSNGIIIQSGHPNKGQSIADTVLVFSNGLSGATAGAALTECLRTGNGPVALVLPIADAIVVTASVVAGELYDKQIPILQIAPEDITRIPNGVKARVESGVLIVDTETD